MGTSSRTGVPFGRPSIGESDIKAVVDVLRSGWIAYGPHVDRFEARLAEWVGSKAAVTLNSCTTALEAVLRCAGVGGEVVVPSFTWVAVANAVVNAGARATFADVDDRTFNLTPESIEERVGPRTEAVIVPHYGGQMADIVGIQDLCRRRGLLLVEDCAETMGGRRDGILAGSTGVACFSFYPTKAITTAMGGAVAGDDQQLIDRIRTYATHGLRSSTPVDGSPHRPWERAAVMPGRNLRMPNLLAALGLAQLDRLDELNELRRDAARRYDAALSGMPGISTPHVATGAHHVYQMYSLRVSGGRRDAMLQHLWNRGISANTHFDPPIHAQPWYVEATTGRPPLPNTETLRREILTIPVFPSITDEEIESVAGAIAEGLEA
jgi:perosamine synthetase